MEFELYQEIALTRDIPEYQLKKGDVATLLDIIPHPHGGEKGCILEVFNAIGESIKVVTIPISAIKKLTSEDILTSLQLIEIS